MDTITLMLSVCKFRDSFKIHERVPKEASIGKELTNGARARCCPGTFESVMVG